MVQSGAENEGKGIAGKKKITSGMSIKEHIRPFLTEYEGLGHHGQAITNLSRRVPHFIRFLNEEGIEENEINLQTAYAYQGYLIDRGRLDGGHYKISTVRSYINAASSYTSWLKASGRILTNPFSVMRKIPEEKSLPKNLPREEAMGEYLKELSRFNNQKTFKNRLRTYRTHVMAETLYASGLRLSELGDVKIEDVDLIGGRIFVPKGKGGKSRYVFLTEYTCRILDIYIQKVRPLILRYYPSSDKTRLFLSSPDTLVHTLNKPLKESSGEYQITAHKIRHCLGYHLLRSGCPLRYIQQILGHTHIHTSEIYTKVDGEKLTEMLSSCHPRSHLLKVERV